ncbi:hypothetical protein HMPREF2805_03375 [Streptococcus sp. HMSC034E03]|uniref:DUF6892 domain-containing protein n=1 Tax=Streptococcus sp. HMSC034E03 TaxID=1739309 RepID=UPI0008B7C706|nr:hypothetical protein [Streptococcus sp. HMSC034E03]OFK75955.1 hypothetical protein HMPREF2805_03375 [Streptococcus sp. HMSC034E03]
MFDFFRKKKAKVLSMNFHGNSIDVLETSLHFPLSLKDIETVFGKPDRFFKKEGQFIKYIYDELGFVFVHSFEIKQHLKSCEVYIDEEHLITSLYLYFGEKVKPMWDEEELPLNPCKTLITCNGIPETITDTLSISYFPEVKHERESYKLKETDEELLHFDNINFKLTIIQVLMYDLRVLKPYFDIYDFADEFSELEIDTESMEIIQPALDYTINLPIPKKYAEQVQEIYMDGGNEIYLNLIPQWDGEDDGFDLNEVSLKELQQFPNLKQATIISSNFEHVKETFDMQGVQVKVL